VLGIQSPLGLQGAYLGDGAAVAAGAGAFCVVEVLFPVFFDRLRTLAPFLRWVFGITIILSVMVRSYGVETGLGSGPVPVMTPALPSPRPLPAVLPVVPVPVICAFASEQIKDPAQTPTKMICESLDKFMWFRLSGRDPEYACRISSADLGIFTRIARRLFPRSEPIKTESWIRL